MTVQVSWPRSWIPLLIQLPGIKQLCLKKITPVLNASRSEQVNTRSLRAQLSFALTCTGSPVCTHAETCMHMQRHACTHRDMHAHTKCQVRWDLNLWFKQILYLSAALSWILKRTRYCGLFNESGNLISLGYSSEGQRITDTKRKFFKWMVELS